MASIDFGSDYGEVNLHHEDEIAKRIFKVTTTDGIIRFAKVVVLAIGAGGKPNMPRELSAVEKEGACHSTQLPKQVFLAPSMMQKILKRAPTAVMIVGGGLTAGQIANQCIENGVGHVFMVMRSALKRTSEVKAVFNDHGRRAYRFVHSKTVRYRSRLDGEISERSESRVLVGR